jgi:hypothetical protein
LKLINLFNIDSINLNNSIIFNIFSLKHTGGCVCGKTQQVQIRLEVGKMEQESNIKGLENVDKDIQNWVLKGDLGFLENWSKLTNTTPDKLKETLLEKKALMDKNFPSQPEELRRFKAIRILKSEYRRKFMTKDTTFEGVVVYVSKTRDQYDFTRKDNLNKLKEYVKQGTPERAVMEKLVKVKEGFDVKTLNLDNINKYIEEYFNWNIPIDKKTLQVLYPVKKRDGEISKMMGKVIPPPDFTARQTALAVIYDENENKVKGASLSLQGKVVTEDIPVLKPVMFRGTIYGDSEVLQINCSNTDFIPSSNEKVKQLLDAYDVPVLIEKTLTQYVVRQSKLLEWEESLEIPKEYKYLTIVKDAVMTYNNMTPTGNNNVTIYIEEEDVALDAEKVSSRIYYPFDKAVDLNFAEGSKVMVIGRCFIGQQSEEYEGREPNLVFMGDIIIPYKENMILAEVANDISNEALQTEEEETTKENTEEINDEEFDDKLSEIFSE